MYEISVIKHFSGAHKLKNYGGKCEALHGHNWKVEVVICSKKLTRVGMVYDFTLLKRVLDKVLSKLDHKYLNELEAFEKTNPTAENIAKYIYDAIKLQITNYKLQIKRVNVWESETSRASYCV